MSLGTSAWAAAHRAAGLGKAVQRTATHAAFPRIDGLLPVRGADGMIEVIRDRHGVPHVFASHAADAAFGHGFVHAQDRLFQMEGARRVASGRLAEAVGPDGLRSDRLLRRCGLRRAALRDAEAIASTDNPVRAIFEAYVRGVNEGVRHLPALPPEFALLGDRFEPWTMADSMLIGRYLMFGFAGNWNTELVRERLAQILGPELASALDPVHPEAFTVTGERYPRTAEQLQEAYEAALHAGMPSGAASNAWAVTSKRSGTGAALLASDPHVDVSLPGIFHVAHLDGGDLDVIGAGVPGIPGVLIGHNQSIAWGITAGMADVADCYIEEFDPAAPRRYRTPQGWAEAGELIEVIDVLGQPSVEERVLVTRHGPIVSPALRGEQRAVALRSTVVEGTDIATPLVALWQSSTLDEAQQAVRSWPGTTFNFVFATREDRIGYSFAGQVPQRPAGVGLFPQDGRTSEGPPPVHPAEALPRATDPTSEFVVSANNAPGGSLELGEEWCEPSRANRIIALIEERDRHDVASFARIQTDRVSMNLVRLRNLVLERGLAEGDAREVLVAWDGQMSPESAGAALMSRAYRALITDCVERIAGRVGPVLLGRAVDGIPVNSAFSYRTQGAIVHAAEAASGPWFVDAEDRDRRVRGAVTRATALLRDRSASKPREWQLGDVQHLPHHHAFHEIPGLRQLFSRGEHPFGGDVNTIVQAQGSLWAETSIVRIAPGYRQVVNLGDWDASVFMVPTGNSGIPGHPRYDDCIEEYVAGQYRPLLFSREAVEAAAEGWLVLEREATG